ncbi:MAG: transcription elongation factor GreA [Candidatus Sungbacteria bacterium RIFCSPHIGHO2_02_FULL_52_23]|uniref:Transcription elongation factor GreA n=1 Tax=Candidatus Sungbacteria bacterium RIFCSPHIGHO2_02_FULL_52_23 TaxID=1802274 RepID=A0A1G2KT61_9BACT|nr:MAG: transcription elongation factor GreA [Candidatus Sungbacteria bacterium RIFCSPHIGHO2_02_FULL_52_23]
MSEYLSEEGLEKLKTELHHLKTAKRQEIAARLEHAKTLGDLSENAEYQETKEEQALVEQRIAELEERVRDAVVMQKPTKTDTVRVGSTVRVSSVRGDATYMIVGSEEADPVGGKISNESPLGKAFLGKKAGDKAEVKTPAGAVMYTIKEIK